MSDNNNDSDPPLDPSTSEWLFDAYEGMQGHIKAILDSNDHGENCVCCVALLADGASIGQRFDQLKDLDARTALFIGSAMSAQAGMVLQDVHDNAPHHYPVVEVVLEQVVTATLIGLRNSIEGRGGINGDPS